MKRAIVASLLLLGSVVAGAVAEQPAANAQPNPIPVRCLAFSRDGKSLAAAYGGSDSVIVWDVASRRAKYKGRERAEIRAVAFSPVNETLAIGSGSLAKLVERPCGAASCRAISISAAQWKSNPARHRHGRVFYPRRS